MLYRNDKGKSQIQKVNIKLIMKNKSHSEGRRGRRFTKELNITRRGSRTHNNILKVRSVFKISILFLRPRPWQFEIRDSTDKRATYLFLGFETLNLKFCDLKLWKLTVREFTAICLLSCMLSYIYIYMRIHTHTYTYITTYLR